MSYIKTSWLSVLLYCAFNAHLLLSPTDSIGTPKAVKASDTVGQFLCQEGVCLVPAQSLSTGVIHHYLLRN